MNKQKKANNLLLKIENILVNWIITKRHQIFLFLIIGVLLTVLSSAPYINLVLTKGFLIFLFFMLGLIIFVSMRSLIFVAIALLILALPFILVREYESAEVIGNLVYGVLLVGIIKAILDIGTKD